MSKLLSPQQHITRLEMQPNFPMEDLTEDNTAMLRYILQHAAGLDAYAKQLKDKQHYIHQVANRAIRLLGLQTRHDPSELYAFSHGFAGFETISDLVHPAQAYDLTTASERVAQFLVDTRSLFDIEAEHEIFAPAEQAVQPDEEENELLQFEGSHTNTDDTDTDKSPTYMRITLTPSMENALRGLPTEQLVLAGHDHLSPEEVFTKRHGILPEQFPNTYDVVVAMGEVRHETMAQLQLRVAGASLARTLQTRD